MPGDSSLTQQSPLVGGMIPLPTTLDLEMSPDVVSLPQECQGKEKGISCSRRCKMIERCEPKAWRAVIMVCVCVCVSEGVCGAGMRRRG